jgi:hypothetical protein
MARAMPGFTAAITMTTPATPLARVQTWADSSRTAWVYPQARIMARAPGTGDAGQGLASQADGGASCYCPCCIISGGILWCC